MNAITPPRNDTEALLLEKFQALLSDLDTAGDNAQCGHVLDKDYTCGARRLIEFAAAKSSFEAATFQLKEFGYITVSHQTVSNLVASLSDEVASKLHNNVAVHKEFQEAKDDTEFTAAGAFIKICNEDKTHCWLECKVADLTKRERGKSAMPDE
ncbi:MAG: hypothetical protein LBN39_02555 [Planctomycetaceae bacterium]|jgi:hypothetical protein|nr:hypothetical protein [Planctomycetaceae bacterium]